MLVFLWVLLLTNLKADNAINLSTESMAVEIETLEKNAKNINAYTTKYFKKRNYESPFSSESQDYKDSILIQKIPQKNETKDDTNATDFKADSHNADSKAVDSADSKDSTQKPKIYKKILESPKPKVVIIIDDIANTKQLDAIKSVGLKLTPSIFPQNNAKMLDSLANLDFFMVHLPLEAISYKDEMDTIKLSDSKDMIEQKIAQIKHNMPKTRYINNHTGSKFTENKQSMELLLSVLDSYNINFVDSRTTQNTSLNDIAKEQNRLILYRDIFIDNELDYASLQMQINEGVKIAKNRGYAILIAHPHKETFNALKNAKSTILKEVDVIYLNELDSMLKKANITQYAKSILK